jgi:hypothetical protein
LKKKKQKNFYPFGLVGRRRLGLSDDIWKWIKVFLVLFPCAAPSPSHLKKELLAFLPLALPTKPGDRGFAP